MQLESLEVQPQYRFDREQGIRQEYITVNWAATSLRSSRKSEGKVAQSGAEKVGQI
jgi:hypothetical protein